MTTAIPPPFPQSAVEQICRILGEAVTGNQIAGLIAPLKVTEAPEDRQGTKWKRLFNAVASAQSKQRDGRPLIRLVSEVMTPVRFDSPERLEATRAAVNERLLLYGFEVLPDGRIRTAVSAQTLNEAMQRARSLQTGLADRGVHARVMAFCRSELLEENYFHAVLEACKSVADHIRELTGLTDDGNSLVDKATSTAAGLPLLAFNSLSTAWERSEHTGLATLAKGLFSAIRNPTAHAPRVQWAVNEQEALDVLTIASMLHRRLDQAIVHPRPTP